MAPPVSGVATALNRAPSAARPRHSESLVRYLNPLVLVRNLFRHRQLLGQLLTREIQGRYKGSVLGILWSFITPLVMLLLYTFVFGVVFKARWNSASDERLGTLAVVLFCGLSAFNLFAEAANRAGSVIVSVPNYVKKVIFPLELLPVATLGPGLLQAAVSFALVIGANLLLTHHVPWTVVLLPVVAVPLIFLTLGVSWFLASTGVFLRDVHHSVGLLMQMLFFATPIFYPLETVPAGLRSVMLLNPLTIIVDDFRRVVLWETLPAWRSFGITLIATGAVMMAGYAWFMKSRRAFADVI